MLGPFKKNINYDRLTVFTKLFKLLKQLHLPTHHQEYFILSTHG